MFKNNQIPFYLMNSVLVHLLLVALLMMFTTSNSHKPAESKNNIKTIEFEISNSQKTSKTIHKITNQNFARINSPKTNKHLNLNLIELSSNKITEENQTESKDNTDQSVSQNNNLFEKSNDSYSLMKALYNKINNDLEFQEELGNQNIEGSINVKITVANSGIIKNINILSSSHSMLEGHVLQTINNSFRTPLVFKNLKSDLIAYLNFKFGIYPSKESVPSSENLIVGNQIHFFRYLIKPNKYLKLNNKADLGRPEDSVLFVDLTEVWRQIFGSEKPTSNRIEWDLNFRKTEFIRACENQNAEGGCYNAGLIEEAFGNYKIAKELFDKGCKLNYEQSCNKLKSIRME